MLPNVFHDMVHLESDSRLYNVGLWGEVSRRGLNRCNRPCLEATGLRDSTCPRKSDAISVTAKLLGI